MPHQTNSPLRKVGALWKPRPGSKSLGSGQMTIAGQRLRFVVLKNDRKAKDTEPDYVLMSSSDPEPDTYAHREAMAPARAEVEDDIAF